MANCVISRKRIEVPDKRFAVVSAQASKRKGGSAPVKGVIAAIKRVVLVQA